MMGTMASRGRYAVVAAALVAVSAFAVVFALRVDPASLAGGVDPDNLPVGPAVPGVEGGVAWLNSPELGGADLGGKVVLYDFWTYSCVNCVRTLPYLRAWYDRYAADGLVIVGVHSPEFNFERSRANVEAATARLGVTWPVVMDNDLAIWQRFGNAYWPSKYVADRTGRLRYRHIGEGAYEETEEVLRVLLGVDEAAPRAAPPGAGDRGLADGAVTAETYLGLRRGATGAQRGEATYGEPGPLAPGEARLAGTWFADDERVTARSAGAAVVLAYRAREVNLVMTAPPGGSGPAEVAVELDGEPLPPAYRTADTVVAADGATVVRVEVDGLYRLVLGPAVEERTLRLTVRAPGVSAFAFTFGA